MSKVNLVWVTPDAENLLSYIARVSNPENQVKQLSLESPDEMNYRLIKYLIKNKHWSPFQMANICLEINTTRAVSAQIIRHSSFSFQEFSQRYSDVAELKEFDYPEVRYKGTSNRQSSLTEEEAEVNSHLHEDNQLIAKTAIDNAYSAYQTLIDKGVALESARMVLPMCAPTRLYMNGTLRSWIHYLSVRRDRKHAQKEHFEIADEINAILKDYFPLTWRALEDV